MISYETALKLKENGFPQNEEHLYCAEDFEGIILRDIVDAIARVRGQHRTFDYSIYPEPTPDDWTQGKARNSYYFSREYLNSEEGKKYTVYFPTLSELIEACGEEFSALHALTFSNDWQAVSWVREGGTIPLNGVGKTPFEAVANLWLELNKNKHEAV